MEFYNLVMIGMQKKVDKAAFSFMEALTLPVQIWVIVMLLMTSVVCALQLGWTDSSKLRISWDFRWSLWYMFRILVKQDCGIHSLFSILSLTIFYSFRRKNFSNVLYSPSNLLALNGCGYRGIIQRPVVYLYHKGTEGLD